MKHQYQRFLCFSVHLARERAREHGKCFVGEVIGDLSYHEKCYSVKNGWKS